MRRYGEPKRPNITYTDRPGAYAVLVRENAILLTHQTEPKPEFQLPGGGIDPGESPLQALHREVMEETGWRIRIGRRLGAYQRYTYMEEYDLWARKICHIYLARPTFQIGPPIEDFHSAHWVDWNAAPQMVESRGDAAFLRRFLRGK